MISEATAAAEALVRDVVQRQPVLADERLLITREQIAPAVDEQLVVELYSR